MMSFLSYRFMRKACSFSGLLALLSVAAVYPAVAQSDWEAQNRIKRLENEVDTLSRAVYRGESPPPGSATGGSVVSGDLEIRLQQVENDMRALRGTLEQQGYELRQLKDQLERVSGDLELRMDDLEGGDTRPGGGASHYTTGRVAPKVPRRIQQQSSSVDNAEGQAYQWSSSGNDSAESQGRLGSYKTGNNEGRGADLAAATYENAFSMVKSRQYDQAQLEFESFLRDYPGHALAGNAKYWLGETYYVRGDFETAARIFAEGYKQYPKGSKAADNLLKLGLSLEALGKKDDACVALQQLKKEHPVGATPVLRRANQEMNRLGCP